MPDLLITTPESLQLLLAAKGYASIFKNCTSIVIDEWHELLGTKRGVQVELGLSRLKTIAKTFEFGVFLPQLGICSKRRKFCLELILKRSIILF